MKCRFLLTVGVILWSTWSGFAIEKTTVSLDNLVKTFEQNPANPQTTMQLLKELSKQGKSGQDILNVISKPKVKPITSKITIG